MFDPFLQTLLVLFVVYDGDRIATSMEHIEALQAVPIIATSASGEAASEPQGR